MTEEPSKPPGEFAAFFRHMAERGCASEAIQNAVELILLERRKAARLFYTQSEDEPLSARAVADALDELCDLAVALELAIMGATTDAKLGSYGDGLAKLAGDLALKAGRLQKAVSAELSLAASTQADGNEA